LEGLKAGPHTLRLAGAAMNRPGDSPPTRPASATVVRSTVRDAGTPISKTDQKIVVEVGRE